MAQFERPKAKLTVNVIDENSAAVAGAKVGISFTERTSNQPRIAMGETDRDGHFSGEGYSDIRLNADARKGGYYISGSPWIVFTNQTDGRYLPWNPTVDIILRQIENPVPVYAKWAWLKVPEVDKPCGYDLMEGDWVAPWGIGKVSDFVFNMQSNYSNHLNLEVSMELRFTQPQDGILKTELPKEFAQSSFIWPRQAPDTGYQSSWRQEFGIPHKQYRIPDIEKQKFFFRVRTVEKDGKIVSALYGKLWEGFQIGAENSNKCIVRLSYYLNPTPLDRNMEFDLKSNLLKSIGEFEDPKRP